MTSTDLFKFAVVRAPRKPDLEESPARRIPYALDSALHSALKADRTAAGPRPAMIATATGFKNTSQ